MKCYPCFIINHVHCPFNMKCACDFFCIVVVIIIIISIYLASAETYCWAATVTLLSCLHEAISTLWRVQQLRNKRPGLNN